MGRSAIAGCGLLALSACIAAPHHGPAGRPQWAIAIHGGAGTIPRSTPPAEVEAYRASLRAALELGVQWLEAGASALDVAEAVVMQLEDDPLFNAGRGAVFTAAGDHELDASIMDGATLACGAVTGVRTVRHPISLARAVMERTPHILLAGQGAEDFASEVRLERVENSWFSTEKRRLQLERALEARAGPAGSGTVGAVVLDRHGHLAAATSTGGMTAKRSGRVGDTPLIGAGNFADDRTCAVSGTGTGEQFIRHGSARAIADRMLLAGMSAAQAAEDVVLREMEPGDGGVIVVSKDGEIAMPYTSAGMFRGAADANGRFEVAIWEP
jgi:beta-aspartyl-peptidase (threonine type)